MTARVALLGLALLLACRPPPAPPPPPEPFHADAEHFLWRQQLRWSMGPVSGSADAVVQSRCGELLVLLLDPFGVPGVEVRRRGGGEVEVVTRGPALPFAPEWILRDVERTYLRRPASREPGQADVTSRQGLLWVRERWAGPQLVERTFHRDASGRAVWRARYGAAGAPARVEIEDLEAGYRIEVTTVARSTLRCEGAPPPDAP